jgi:hypothetical protein
MTYKVKAFYRSLKEGLNILGYVPEDENVSDYDGVARPLLKLPSHSPSVMPVRRILKRIV